MRLKGYEDLLRRGQGVERQQAERRGAVDKAEIEFVRYLFQRLAQNDLSADNAYQFALGADQVDIGGQDPKVQAGQQDFVSNRG